jgi:hypothetical protein
MLLFRQLLFLTSPWVLSDIEQWFSEVVNPILCQNPTPNTLHAHCEHAKLMYYLFALIPLYSTIQH